MARSRAVVASGNAGRRRALHAAARRDEEETRAHEPNTRWSGHPGRGGPRHRSRPGGTAAAGRPGRFHDVPRLPRALGGTEGRRRGAPGSRETRLDRQVAGGTRHLGGRDREREGHAARRAARPAGRGELRGRSRHRKRAGTLHDRRPPRRLRLERRGEAAPGHVGLLRAAPGQPRRRGSDVRAGEVAAPHERGALRRRQRRAHRRRRSRGSEWRRRRDGDAREGFEGDLHRQPRRRPAHDARRPGKGRVRRMGDLSGRPRQRRRRVHQRGRPGRRGPQPQLHAPVPGVRARRRPVHGERDRDTRGPRLRAEAPEHRRHPHVRPERQPDRRAGETRRDGRPRPRRLRRAQLRGREAGRHGA